MRTTVKTYRAALLFLRMDGTKAAMQSKAEGPFVFVEKADLIQTIKGQLTEGPTNYDSNDQEWFIEQADDGRILYILYDTF